MSKDNANSNNDYVIGTLPKDWTNVKSICVPNESANTVMCPTPTYRLYELDTSKITDIEDCKNILKVLFDRVYGTPLPDGVSYGGLAELQKYCKVKEVL